MKTAAAYIRVSTEDQAEYSPDSQLKIIRSYVKEHDMILPDDYIFSDEGISGRQADKRPGFQQMIAASKIKPTPFDCVIVWKFSRFARNRLESMTYKKVLEKNNISVISISEPIGDEPTAIIMESIIEAMDEYYSINLSGEVKRGLNEKFSRGEPITPPPLGYKFENGVFVPEEAEASFVKMIYNDYLSGLSAYKIAKKLNNMGIRSKKGNLFERQTIEYILTNPVYTGKLRKSKSSKERLSGHRWNNTNSYIIVDGKHSPIISDEIFNLVQKKYAETKKIYNKNARQTDVEFMLKGLVRCDTCGSTLRLNKAFKALQCTNYTRGACKVSHYIKLDALNKVVIDKLKSDLTSEHLQITINERPTEETLPDIKSWIEREKKKLSRVKEAYEAGIDTLEEYKENKLKIQARINELTAQAKMSSPVPNENYDKIISERIRRGLDILESSETSETLKNITLRSFIDRIVYFKPKNIIEIFYKL